MEKLLIYVSEEDSEKSEKMIRYLKHHRILHKRIVVDNNPYIKEWLLQEGHHTLPIAFGEDGVIGNLQNLMDYLTA